MVRRTFTHGIALLAILACGASTPARSDDCPLDRLRALLAQDPAAPRFGKSFLPGDTPVSQLMRPDGDITLFRVIQGRHIKGHARGEWLDLEKAYSYSMSPHIARQWQYYDNNYIVISRQNVLTEKLTYPSRSVFESQLSGGDSGSFWTPLTPETRLRDIAYYDEVKVPIAAENALAQIPRETYLNILKSLDRARRDRPSARFARGRATW